MSSHQIALVWEVSTEQKLNVAIFHLRKVVCQARASFQEGWQAPSSLVPFHGERESLSGGGKKGLLQGPREKERQERSLLQEDMKGSKSVNSTCLEAETMQDSGGALAVDLGPPRTRQSF